MAPTTETIPTVTTAGDLRRRLGQVPDDAELSIHKSPTGRHLLRAEWRQFSAPRQLRRVLWYLDDPAAIVVDRSL